MNLLGTLYLVPTALGGEARGIIPGATSEQLFRLTSFIVEDTKRARQFLKAVDYPHPLQQVHMRLLNEHTTDNDLRDLLGSLLNGGNCGLMSDAGCPAVADPGARLVSLAHERGIRVVPLVGPSAILLALMASGLNGQRFAFHGYLPVQAEARRTKLIELERDSRRADRTQIFIETPYRNEAMLRAIVQACRGESLVCIATDLTLPSESVRTQSVSAWRTQPPRLDRRPTVFLLYSSQKR